MAGGRFPPILDLFQGLEVEVPRGGSGETSICKIIMIDDVTLWSKLKSTYLILLILFHRRMIFKMLAVEQSAEKLPFSTSGSGRSSDRSETPPGYGPGRTAFLMSNVSKYCCMQGSMIK